MMKTQYGKLLLNILFLIIALAAPALLFAQGPDPDVPIDGGLSLLLAAGVGYGVKKYRDTRKQANAENELK